MATLTRNSARPDRKRTSSSPAITVTAPGSNERTMSTTKRDGTSTDPSTSPATSQRASITRSGSEPQTSNCCPRRWSFSPMTPKLDPERVLVALDAVTRVSRRVSRSARNFTECSTPFELEKKTTGVVGPGDCGYPRLLPVREGRTLSRVILRSHSLSLAGVST